MVKNKYDQYHRHCGRPRRRSGNVLKSTWPEIVQHGEAWKEKVEAQ